jgi:3-oxoacyl-[acyl-carrier protein] reductase
MCIDIDMDLWWTGIVAMTAHKVAIVTGAGRGIGAAIAERLSADGAQVAIFDLDKDNAERTAESINRNGGTAKAFLADVGNAEDVQDAVARVASELGAPTILVNNAGVTRDAMLFKMTELDWDTVMNVHLKGAFNLTKAVQGHMVTAGWGRVVNISSISAFGNRGQTNYAAAKAGLLGFTKAAAIELGKFGITVNAVGPGFIVTEMTRDTAKRVGQPWEEFVADKASQIPVGRAGEPSDIAHAVAFYVSEGASFVSGQVLWVAGGPKG